MLNITEVRIKRIDKEEFLGYASICIDNQIVLDGIKLLKGKNGRYILMPVIRKKSSNKVRNYIYPINNKTRTQLLNAISEEYDRT